MTRIYEDKNGVAVNAISSLADGTNVEGHIYDVLSGTLQQRINFQLGPAPANGVNGLTTEALLAIAIHRTQFLDEQFPSQFNKRAINDMQNALHEFEERTRSRTERGVEGKEVI
jgi:hypothetical protein